MTAMPIHDGDIQSLAEKMAAFAQTLTPGEQAALEMVEQQLGTIVAPDKADVEGYLLQLNELAAARQSDLLAEAERDRQAAKAAAAPAEVQQPHRVQFWRSMIAALTGPLQPGGTAGG